jgi:hypothetical protein
VVCFARDDVRQPFRARQVRGDNVILETVTHSHSLPALGKSTTESRDVRPRAASVSRHRCTLVGVPVEPVADQGAATYVGGESFGEKHHGCPAPWPRHRFVRAGRLPESGITHDSRPEPRIHRRAGRNSRHSAKREFSRPPGPPEPVPQTRHPGAAPNGIARCRRIRLPGADRRPGIVCRRRRRHQREDLVTAYPEADDPAIRPRVAEAGGGPPNYWCPASATRSAGPIRRAGHEHRTWFRESIAAATGHPEPGEAAREPGRAAEAVA